PTIARAILRFTSSTAKWHDPQRRKQIHRFRRLEEPFQRFSSFASHRKRLNVGKFRRYPQEKTVETVALRSRRRDHRAEAWREREISTFRFLRAKQCPTLGFVLKVESHLSGFRWLTRSSSFPFCWKDFEAFVSEQP